MKQLYIHPVNRLRPVFISFLEKQHINNNDFSIWDEIIEKENKSYSPAYLQKYRKMYPILGLVGKPKSYDRFLANAKAILEFDAYEKLSNIKMPTLIIGGENDKIVGVQASEELHEQIAGSDLFIYPGLGHAAYEEAKDFNQRVF